MKREEIYWWWGDFLIWERGSSLFIVCVTVMGWSLSPLSLSITTCVCVLKQESCWLEIWEERYLDRTSPPSSPPWSSPIELGPKLLMYPSPHPSHTPRLFFPAPSFPIINLLSFHIYGDISHISPWYLLWEVFIVSGIWENIPMNMDERRGELFLIWE